MVLKAKELRKETQRELETKLKDLRNGFLELRFQHATGTLKNPIRIRQIKRDIARLLTVIREKENE
ncbi:MAG: 50S ribosomal protein L29 [Elusimicrobia bacterium]|jgi:large subunit ribosomal protein L29|nr:50S ribosomal protein L29 [Elusimicrobiota bacterium]